MDIMNEILLENEPGKEGEEDFSLMQDLNTTLRSMQERATELIGRGISEEIVLGEIICNSSLLFCYLMDACPLWYLYIYTHTCTYTVIVSLKETI